MSFWYCHNAYGKKALSSMVAESGGADQAAAARDEVPKT
jgi:hypothetical protein